MDWQVGDLALCIKQGRWRGATFGEFRPARNMRAGIIATVRRVGVWQDSISDQAILTLWFEGWPGERFQDGFGAVRFVKVTPPKQDDYIDEIIAEQICAPSPVFTGEHQQ